MEPQVNVYKKESLKGKGEENTIDDIHENAPSESDDCVLNNERCLNGYMFANGEAKKFKT